MGLNCCKENYLDDITPCKLSDDDLPAFTIAYETKHAEAMKGWTVCLVDAN